MENKLSRHTFFYKNFMTVASKSVGSTLAFHPDLSYRHYCCVVPNTLKNEIESYFLKQIQNFPKPLIKRSNLWITNQADSFKDALVSIIYGSMDVILNKYTSEEIEYGINQLKEILPTNDFKMSLGYYGDEHFGSLLYKPFNLNRIDEVLKILAFKIDTILNYGSIKRIYHAYEYLNAEYKSLDKLSKPRPPEVYNYVPPFWLDIYEQPQIYTSLMTEMNNHIQCLYARLEPFPFIFDCPFLSILNERRRSFYGQLMRVLES